MEDTQVMATCPKRCRCHGRRLLFGMLLLLVPACGLSEYESLMQKSQERSNRFREEQKNLDAPVVIPTEKDKEGHEVPIMDVFFRPPKGIESTPQQQPRDNLMWQYRAGAHGSEFFFVEMAFNDGDKEFARKVVAAYPWDSQAPTPEHKPPWPFDSWEFNRNAYGYSINIYKGGSKEIAIVYIFRKEKRDTLRRAIDLSLQSLTEKAGTARKLYNEKSPWRLEAQPGS